MPREDGRVVPSPEKFYSLGPDLAGIVGKDGIAFEIQDGGSGDVFVSVGKFSSLLGTVEKDDQVLFDLPSVGAGGGRHPYTAYSLDFLRTMIINYSQTSLGPNEEVPNGFSSPILTALSGNKLRISFIPFNRVFLGLKIYARDEKRGIHRLVSLFEDEKLQTKFAGIINAFKRLAEAMQEDGDSIASHP